MKQCEITNEELLRQTIDYLRFPLIVGVVFIHNNIGSFTIQGNEVDYGELWPWVGYVVYFFSKVLPSVSVPLFFFISGFLFYYNVDFCIDVYKQKIKRRCNTLLIPYLIWNFVGFIILLIQMHPRFMTLFPLLQDYRIDITEFLSYFYGKNLPMDPPDDAAAPIDYPLWFVRDLMVLVLASPIIYWGIKRCKFFFVAGLGVVWLFQLLNYIGLPFECNKSIFFFPLGAYFSINRLNFVEIFNESWWSPFLFALLAIVNTLSYAGLIPFLNNYLRPFNLFVGMIASVYLISFLIRKNKIHINKFLSNASFFVFAAHGLFISKYMKVIIMVVQPSNPFVVIFLYFFVTISSIFICLGIYRILNNKIPLVAQLLTGGR